MFGHDGACPVGVTGPQRLDQIPLVIASPLPQFKIRSRIQPPLDRQVGQQVHHEIYRETQQGSRAFLARIA